MKKIILILSVFLLGCGSAGAGEVISSAPTRSPESENIAVGSSDDAETESRAVQQLTLKNYRNTERVNFGGTELDEYIRDRFGFEIIIESSSTGNAQQEFEKDYSSGGFADITVTALYAWAPDYIKKLEKSSREGLFAEISGLLSTNAPNLNVLINRPQVPSFIRNLVINPENDGEIYFLPHGYFDEPYLTGWGLFIRGDIADALGVQTPDRDYIRTPERFYDLLVRIRDGYFMDTQGMPVYPLGIIDVWPHTMAAIARPFDFGGAGKIDFLNGKLQFFIQTPFAWDNIVWIRRLIDNGLIDPDCFTDGYESGVEKLSNGRYAVTPFYRFMPTSFNGFTNAMTGQNPEMAWRSLGNMENWMKEQHMTLAAVNPFEDASSTAGVVMFNSNTNYLGDVMRMLDWMNTMTGRATVEIGWEDDDWYWNEDGLAQPRSSLVNNQWQESFRDQR
ncbi:MAG: hypothetical protein FWF03_05935, partial [Defluviitaleaceae bacterium]|nr:hypothetical protein [Defluviitaleaceae bacterium]